MSSTIEKNDVDISRLFYYGNKFDILGLNKQVIMSIYIRLVGDAELNKARVFALRSSMEMRNQLKDKNSELHKAFIMDSYSDIEKDDLIQLIINYTSSSIARDSIDDVKLPLPVEPKSDADLEEQEEYQKAVDDYPLKRFALIREKIEQKTEEKKHELSQKTHEELEKEYVATMIASMCEQEMINKFKAMCAYLGTYKDSKYKTKLFTSYEDFDNILPEIKQQIIDSYSSLEMSSDELKK